MCFEGWPQLRATSRRCCALHVGFDFGGSIVKDTGHSLALGEKRLRQRCRWTSCVERESCYGYHCLQASVPVGSRKNVGKKDFKQLEFYSVQFLVPAFLLCRKWHRAHLLWKACCATSINEEKISSHVIPIQFTYLNGDSNNYPVKLMNPEHQLKRKWSNTMI